MSLVVDALTVGGTFLLTVGTGSQAWAAQAEFRSLFGALHAAEDTITGPEMVKVFGPVVYLLVDVEPDASESGFQLRLSKILTKARPVLRVLGALNPGLLLALRMYRPVLRWGTTLAKVRADSDADAGLGADASPGLGGAASGAGGDEKAVGNAVELARFFRQAIVGGC